MQTYVIEHNTNFFFFSEPGCTIRILNTVLWAGTTNWLVFNLFGVLF